MATEKKELRRAACKTFGDLLWAETQARRQLENIVIGAGGFIPLLPRIEDHRILSIKALTDDDGIIDTPGIFGIRYEPNEGLFICTRDCVDNYERETGYTFEYLYNFDGDDLENINKALADISWYRPLDDDGIVVSATVRNILKLLALYLM